MCNCWLMNCFGVIVDFHTAKVNQLLGGYKEKNAPFQAVRKQSGNNPALFRKSIKKGN